MRPRLPGSSVLSTCTVGLVALATAACTPTTALPDRTSQSVAQAKPEVVSPPEPTPEDAEPVVDPAPVTPPLKAEPTPDVVRIVPADPPTCIAPGPALPADLPESAKGCLRPLIEAELSARFVGPPTPAAPPTAFEKFTSDGELLDTSGVERFTEKEHQLRFESADPDNPTDRNVFVETRTFDGKGRLSTLTEKYQDFFFEADVPDCENISTLRHRYDRRGWPTSSKRTIDTCEGVDAGVITTRRTFTEHSGWVEAELAIVDR